MIIKNRAVEILAKISDFDVLKENFDLQQNLVNGLLTIFGSSEGENADFCLKMSCVEYFKNFFNDAEFPTVQYAPLVPTIVESTSGLMNILF